ncbi:MAG: hypothetical protein IPL39_10650 [Opitutaceae bacterium]|nr:hypothetical protein [Opitutaceae bacterium]
MTKPILLFPLLLLGVFAAGSARAERVYVRDEANVPQSSYAVRRLKAALTEAGHTVLSQETGFDRLIRLGVDAPRLAPEAFALMPEERDIVVRGGDPRGMIYGSLALVELLRNGTDLAHIPASEEKPRLPFRGIKFNLPWETYRPTSALDQHGATVRDLKFWEAFLDMMAENRFNVISLWNLNPYTYLVRPANFPEASPWSEAEFTQWQHLYREIFRLAKERGLDTYLVPWNIFVSRPFAEAHGVARENVYPHYYVDGDTSELVRRYLRESVTQVLNEYPDLDGFGISLGEGMGGMTPRARLEWADDVLIGGMLKAGRRSKLLYRVPFSSGLSSGPGASTEVESMTREALERLGDRFDGPIWVEMKFNWSHAHSTPKLVKVHGGKLGDTYFNPPPKNYKVVWMARNEDFFALRWGVPDFIREHLARNGSADYVGGYFVGSECYIPALDYFTAPEQPVDWTWAFQRQWLFYKLWGRLLYDPTTPDTVFQAEFVRRYGAKGESLLQAFALASATQLRLNSLYDTRWDFTLYGEGFLALQGDITKYISVDELITHPVLDPDYVAVADWVAAAQRGEEFAAGRVTPPALADLLERDNCEALRLVAGVDVVGNASLRYEVADVQTWAHLGLHLAEKLRGAVALQTFRKTGDAEAKRAAIEHLRGALGHWDEVVRITRPLYRDMRLTHYNHNFFVPNDDNLFHWARIRGEVAEDVVIAERAKKDE